MADLDRFRRLENAFLGSGWLGFSRGVDRHVSSCYGSGCPPFLVGNLALRFDIRMLRGSVDPALEVCDREAPETGVPSEEPMKAKPARPNRPSGSHSACARIVCCAPSTPSGC